MDHMITPSLAPGLTRPWPAELAWRIRRYMVLKIVGISGFMWVFFIGYFYLLRHPMHPVIIMPLTAVDRMIPFQPHALVAYVSLWVYIGCAPGLLVTMRELIGYALWIAALCLTGLACFYAWPTAVPEFALDVSGYAGFSMLEGVDSAGNACPSLHVATAMFTAIWVDYLLRHVQVPGVMRVLNGGWFVAITYSTLAIKQHVALDALAGVLLGIPFALAALRWHQGIVTGAWR
jgi:hypothetical protein